MSDTKPKPPRKPLTIRFSESEHAKLGALAEHWGLSLAATVRRLVQDKKVPQ